MHIYCKSFQGKRHIQKEAPCQDRCGYCVTPNGWVAAFVADGVSASPLSEKGAEIAVESCREYFSALRFSPFLNAERMRMILRDAFNYALRRVIESGQDGNPVPYSRMTTLQVLLYGGKIGLHWGQAGDGTLILRNRNGEWSRVMEEMKHEEEDNSPVVLQDGPDYWRFGSVGTQELEAMLLTTDGIGDVFFGPEDPEVLDSVVHALMSPPDDEPERETTDAYYQELLFGKDHAGQPCLQSVTDDITVLLIRHLPDPEIRAETETDPETEQETKSGGNAANRGKRILPFLLRTILRRKK